jgi:hypothetical protein
MTITRQRLSKQFSAETDTHTIEEMLEAVFLYVIHVKEEAPFKNT